MARRKKTPEEVKSTTPREFAKAYVPLEDYSNQTLDNVVAINRSSAAYRTRDFSNVLPGISGRPGLTRDDYDYFRPDEAVPTTYPHIINKCNSVYRNVGLIRNIIDLMGDFTSQGVRLVHPNRRIEQFYQSWWSLVNGRFVTERIANSLYRVSNVPIQVYTTKLKPSELERMYRATAEPDRLGLPVTLPDLDSREIPYKYTLLPPNSVVPIGGALSSFVSQPLYGLILPQSLRTSISTPRTPEEKAIVDKLPDDIKEAARNNKLYVLDPEKTVMLYYKKDDWSTFADPMIYAILDDVTVLEKLKLADMSALDGATNKIRIFKLGNIEHKIAPSPAMAEKLSELLQNNVGAGVTDIIWGPDIEILETDVASYQFLGNEKYQGTLNNIYAGLGIPPTLTGTFGAAGTTNNFISLKTLTERLEYGRAVISEFWKAQLKVVQKVMGHRFPAQLAFDRMILGNEDTEKALLIQLADRNLISDEMIQHIFKNDPEMERIRLKRERQERQAGKRVPKAGAWHNNPEPDVEFAKIALQSGQATPSEVGLELKENKQGEVKQADRQMELEKFKIKNKPKPTVGGKKPKGRSGQGRPKTSKDSKKRKAKTFRARSMIESWARAAQNKITETVNPAVLATHNKKNMRQLTTEQAEDAENIKFGVLCSLKPLSEVNDEAIASVINNPTPSDAKELYNLYAGDFVKTMARQPSLEEIRNMQVSVYLTLMLDEDKE
jgi:hypothetical protein